MTLMSLDRYIAIVHVVAAMRTRTLRYGIIASITIWAISIALAAPQVVFASLEIDQDISECQPLYPEKTQEFWKMWRNFCENGVGLFVCLPILIFCYVKILMVLSKSRNSNKNRAIKLIFGIVCVFLVCWVPYNVTVFLQTLHLFEILSFCDNSINTAMGFAEVIALCHCCLNPIIYAFVGDKFRRSFVKILSRYLFCYQSRMNYSHRDTTEKETSNTPVRSEY